MKLNEALKNCHKATQGLGSAWLSENVGRMKIRSWNYLKNGRRGIVLECPKDILERLEALDAAINKIAT